MQRACGAFFDAYAGEACMHKSDGYSRRSASRKHYLIRDRDPLFTQEFLTMLKAAGVQ